MIHIQPEDADEILYIINLSRQGNHVLFAPDVVRWATRSDSPEGELAEAAVYHMESLVYLEGLARKLRYLASLDLNTRILVARIYFNMVENEILRDGVCH